MLKVMCLVLMLLLFLLIVLKDMLRFNNPLVSWNTCIYFIRKNAYVLNILSIIKNYKSNNYIWWYWMKLALHFLRFDSFWIWCGFVLLEKRRFFFDFLEKYRWFLIFLIFLFLFDGPKNCYLLSLLLYIIICRYGFLLIKLL